MTFLLGMFGNAMEGGILLAALAVYVVPLICLWFVFKKAGFAPAWSLFALIPGGWFVLICGPCIRAVAEHGCDNGEHGEHDSRDPVRSALGSRR